MTLPAKFKITITGSVPVVLGRSNITPGQLGRLMEAWLTGGDFDPVVMRGWGLAFTVEEIDVVPPPQEPSERPSRQP